ncbi:Putative leucine-rich repeat domain superfamily [Septoria linicola]|uniref:Leucine-rich repeat domain superfamily n=1 Tax=Septoria linicola TaxID=215465 RepID=A0A9Q9AW37_9PEZI|nr:putative leucine-rich repeat domain superfamily [Septoria linicola]USW56524.1 Putative leucine-rich repeat domain superfamily [Septoria linicola]
MADSKAAEPTMLGIPAEVLENICSNASPRDIGALRATSREMLHKLDSLFAKAAFETIELHLGEKHLQFLKDIAASRFAAKVKYMYIRPRYLHCPPRHDERGRLIESTDEEQGFQMSGNDVKWLAQALSGFTSLVRIEVEATTTSALPKSLAEDGSRTSWSALAVNDLPVTGLSYAFRIVLSALAEMQTKDRSIKELRAGALPYGVLRRSIDHPSLALGECPCSISQGLSSLEALELVLEVQRGACGGGSCSSSLATFLHNTANLKRLKLSFWHMAGEWLSDTFREVNLQHLEHFHLQAVHRVDFTQLEAFLGRHKSTLRTLELQNMIFTNDALADIFPAIFTSGDLQLHSVKLQQLCSLRKGLLLFDTSFDYIWDACDKDRDSTWANKTGPGCRHATLAANGNELATKEELSRMKDMCMLPWPMRVAPAAQDTEVLFKGQ